MFPCALCSCRRTRPGSLAPWEQDRPGQTGASCVTQPPLELHQWPFYWDGRLNTFQWKSPPISQSCSPRVHARTRTRQWPASSLDRREQAPRLPGASHGARAAGCGLRAGMMNPGWGSPGHRERRYAEEVQLPSRHHHVFLLGLLCAGMGLPRGISNPGDH